MPPREPNKDEIAQLRLYLRNIQISEVVVSRMLDGADISIFDEYWHKGHKEKVMAVIWPQGTKLEQVYIFRTEGLKVYRNWNG